MLAVASPGSSPDSSSRNSMPGSGGGSRGNGQKNGCESPPWQLCEEGKIRGERKEVGKGVPDVQHPI